MALTKATQEYLELVLREGNLTRATQEYIELVLAEANKTRVTQGYVELVVLGKPPFLDTVLAGKGAVTAQLTHEIAFFANLQGVGALTADLRQDFAIFAQVLGKGVVTAEINLFLQSMLANLTGHGTLTVPTLDGDFTMTGTLTGNGAMSPELTGDWTQLASLLGRGSIRGRLRKPSDDDEEDVIPPGGEDIPQGLWTVWD